MENQIGLKNPKTRKMKINLSQEYRKFINTEIFGGWRFYYNKTLDYIRDTPKYSLSLLKVRKILYEKFKDKDIKIPYRTKDLAIQQALTAKKTCLTLKKLKYQKKHELKYKEKKHGSQMAKFDYRMMVEKDNKIYLQSSLNKELNTKVAFANWKDEKWILELLNKKALGSDFTIFRNNKYEYYLVVSYENTEKRQQPRFNTVAMDPGIRTFMTIYSPDGIIGKFGENMQKDIKPLQEKYDKIQSLLRENFNHHKRQKLRRRQAVLIAKVQQIVDNLHKKVINFLVDNFQNILIPSFKVSKMVEKQQGNKKRKLSRDTTRSLLSLSHFKFRERLIWKATSLGRKVFVVNEAYTTKTCAHCGTKQEMGSKEVFKCNCGYMADRDINAAKNIYLRFLSKMNRA
jgi:putative transposase